MNTLAVVVDTLKQKDLASLIAASAAWVALIFYLKQATAQSRDHIANVFRLVFEKMDSPEMREGRDYVYNHMSPNSHECEHWIGLENYIEEDSGTLGAETILTQTQHKRWAEMVAHSFDQLGLLVRVCSSIELGFTILCVTGAPMLVSTPSVYSSDSRKPGSRWSSMGMGKPGYESNHSTNEERKGHLERCLRSRKAGKMVPGN